MIKTKIVDVPGVKIPKKNKAGQVLYEQWQTPPDVRRKLHPK